MISNSEGYESKKEPAFRPTPVTRFIVQSGILGCTVCTSCNSIFRSCGTKINIFPISCKFFSNLQEYQDHIYLRVHQYLPILILVLSLFSTKAYMNFRKSLWFGYSSLTSSAKSYKSNGIISLPLYSTNLQDCIGLNFFIFFCAKVGIIQQILRALSVTSSLQKSRPKADSLVIPIRRS